MKIWVSTCVAIECWSLYLMPCCLALFLPSATHHIKKYSTEWGLQPPCWILTFGTQNTNNISPGPFHYLVHAGTVKLEDEGTTAATCNVSETSEISQDHGFSLEDLLHSVFLITYASQWSTFNQIVIMSTFCKANTTSDRHNVMI